MENEKGGITLAHIIQTNDNLLLEQIIKFQIDNNIKLPEKYKQFMLKWNGGYPEPNLFRISDKQGTSVVNILNGIGDMYDNLEKVMEIYKNRLPNSFIPIGDDPGGNVICLGIEKPYNEAIYFWDHENESSNPEVMSNMYFLAKDIGTFLDNLTDDI